MRAFSCAAVVAGLALLAPRVALATAAPTSYTLQPLAQTGGMAGDVPIPKGYTWSLGPMNDNGQFLVDASSSSGTEPAILLQYADGKFAPLAAAGMAGPLGPWPKDLDIVSPSMNARGDTVFTAGHLNSSLVGVFHRDGQSGKMTAVLLPGMPATGNLKFITPGWDGGVTLAINNQDEIALTGQVNSGLQQAVFFRTADGALQPILLPGQALPDGKTVAGPNYDYGGAYPSMTDAGVVAFLVVRSGDTSPASPSAYQWEKGTLTPLVTVGMDAPGGGKIAAVNSVLLNNQNTSALISARVGGAIGLYRLAGGTLTPVAVPDQAMPGGGNFKSVAAVSAATAAGQHAFIAMLEDFHSSALYRLDADGTIALVAKTGMTTPLGTITGFGPSSPPAMNSQGQVVASISFDNGPDTLVLLTPDTP